MSRQDSGYMNVDGSQATLVQKIAVKKVRMNNDDTSDTMYRRTIKRFVNTEFEYETAVPVRTIAPILGSLSYFFKASTSSSMSSPFSAFRAFGRFRVMSPT